MFIQIRGEQYDFRSAYVNLIRNTLIVVVQKDEMSQELEVQIEGNIISAMQIVASELSKYNLLTDFDKELRVRGLYVKGCTVVDEFITPKQKHYVGVDKQELLDDIVCLSQDGLFLLQEIVQTSNGIYLIHTDGSTKLLRGDDVTNITFDHLVDELHTKRKEHIIYTYSKDSM